MQTFTMHQYIIDTEYAAKNLFELANEEQNKLQELTEHLRSVEARLRVHKWDFESSDLNDDFSDAYVMGAFGQMAEAAKLAQTLQAQLASLQASIGRISKRFRQSAARFFRLPSKASRQFMVIFRPLPTVGMLALSR